MKAKTLGLVVGAVASVFAGVVLAAVPVVSFAAGLPAPFEGTSTLQADGLVKAVDPVKHAVTVLDAQGGEASFTITDPGNLAQIRQGGKVHIRMVRNAVISVTRGAGGQGGGAQGAQGVQGAQPNTLHHISAEVQAVDHASGVMVLKDPNGSVFHIQGREPGTVAGVTPGMQVSVAFAQQVSVAVAPAQ